MTTKNRKKIRTGRLIARVVPALTTAGMATAGLAAISSGAYAQTSTTELDAVVVTATRTARSADETIAPVTVINRRDIEQSGAQSVPDVLRATAGVDLSSNGPYGKNTGLFLRGTESDHVVFLIDGVRQYSATTGSTQIQHLPIDQIERIEVLRGPRASLYGAEALGGVIQIFTRRGNGPATLDVVLGGGSDSSAEAGIGISGSNASTRYSVRLSGLKSDGIDVLEGAQLDDDPYDNTSVMANLQHSINDSASIGLNALRTSGSTSFDNSFDSADADNAADFMQQSFSVNGRLDINDSWTSSLRLAESRDESDNFRNDAFTSKFNTKRTELSWQNDYAVSDTGLVTFGVDHSDDQVDSTTNYDVSSRDNTGIYLQWQADYGTQGIVAAIRRDDNEQFGSFTTGNIDYSYRLNQGLRVVASYGRAFRAPSFNELYFPGFGNPSLDAEESESFELGLRGKLENGSWGISAFKNDIDNLIAFDSGTFLPANLDSAEITGLEADLVTRAGSWDLRGALTLLSPEDATTGKTLRRRAKRSLRLDANRDFGRYSLGGSVIHQGKRFEDAANTTVLESYTLLNLQAGYRFNKAFSLEASVENLLDEDYSTASGYREKGRSLFLRLRYRQALGQ